MKFLHAMIRIKDLEASTKFYQDLIGLKLHKTLRLEDCMLYFFRDEITGVDIELTLNDYIPASGYNKGEVFGHFAFQVKNMTDFAKNVKEFGYDWIYEPYKMRENGSTIAFLKDPDGNMIEIIEKHE